MSGDGDDPAHYRVSYSGRVQQRLKELAAVARSRGDGEQFLSALREFDRRLRIYPQFGDPLIDLNMVIGQVRLGAVPPLAMRYVVLEERREVFVGAPPVLLTRRGSM
jgi:hypothetical protein